MNQLGEKADELTFHLYLTIVKLISANETRLRFLEAIYLAVNVIIFLFTISLVTYLSSHKGAHEFQTFGLVFTLLVGMVICVHWIASAMRSQMKLKLRYSQARYLERKLSRTGEHIYLDEAMFFDPEIRKLESPDKKEIVVYPTKGPIRMDGFIGGAKPRVFSWIVPGAIFFLYCVIFCFALIELF